MKRGGRGTGRRSKRETGKNGKFDKRRRLRRKACKLCQDKVVIDFRDVQRLQRFITEKGKIISKRISGNCARCQRQLARAIKRARQMALLAAVAS